MPCHLTVADHKKRKESTRKSFVVKLCPKTQEVLNPEVVSVTNQSFKDQCDINLIMKNIQSGNYNPAVLRPGGFFGDFTEAPDFQKSLQIVTQMQTEFMALSPEIRAKFGNDPYKLLKYLEDPKNEEESIALKLRHEPVIEIKKIDSPEGLFWVKSRNGVEVNRTKIEPEKAAKP